MGGHYFGQFIISRSERQVPAGYITTQCGPWIVYCHQSLPVSSLRTADGGAVGCIVGHLIELGAKRDTGGDVVLPVRSSDSSDRKESVINQFLGQVGGRFVCLFSDGDHQRLYLDTAGSLSCVYAASLQVVASTPGLFLNRESYYADMDHDLAAILDVSRGGWYPAGLTPHREISRLLPNHYLDLAHWRPVRHWPMKKIAPAASVEQKVSAIADILKAIIHAVAREREVYLPITAGRDSRMLLACSRADMDRIDLVTFADSKDNVDTYMVKRLERAHGLKVEYVPIVTATTEQSEQWYYEVGHCVGGRISEIHPTLNSLDRGRVIMPGFGGALAKGHYWRPRDQDDKAIGADQLLRRLNLPIHPVLHKAVSNWMEGVGNIGTFQMLDLAHIEHREGAWGGPQTYGQEQFVTHIYPMFHRGIFEDMISLPQEYRRTQRLHTDVIRREWPELLSLPFNRYSGVRHTLSTAKKALRLPGKLLRLLSGH